MSQRALQFEDIRYSQDSPNLFGIDQSDVAGSERNRRPSFDGFQISSGVLPDVAAAVAETTTALSLDLSLRSFVIPDANLAAFSVAEYGGDVGLFLTSGLIERLAIDELKFVIGHELGHLVFGHHEYPRLSETNPPLVMLNQLALRRATEISADRIGLVAAGSMVPAARAILKVASGLGEKHLRFDLAEYLRKLRGATSSVPDFRALHATHPPFPIRARALLWFSMSASFRSRNSELDGLSLAEVDSRIVPEMAVSFPSADGDTIEQVRLWGTLKISSANGRISRSEQRFLGELVGAELAEKALRFLRTHSRPKKAIEARLGAVLDAAASLSRTTREQLAGELAALVQIGPERGSSAELAYQEIHSKLGIGQHSLLG